MKSTILGIATAALLALGGCNKKSENPAPTPPAGSAATPTAGSGSAIGSAAGSGSDAGSGSAAGSGSDAGSAAAAAVDVPTEQDFEDEATAKITDKNVEAQVQALEKQLAPAK